MSIVPIRIEKTYPPYEDMVSFTTHNALYCLMSVDDYAEALREGFRAKLIGWSMFVKLGNSTSAKWLYPTSSRKGLLMVQSAHTKTVNALTSTKAVVKRPTEKFFTLTSDNRPTIVELQRDRERKDKYKRRGAWR